MMNRIEERSCVKLAPVFLAQPIAIAKRIAKIGDVIGIRRLSSHSGSQNGPIHHRTIRYDALHSRIKRAQYGSSSTETAADDENLVRLDMEHLAESRLANRAIQSLNNFEYVFMRRSLEELPAAFPCAAITRVEDPVPFSREPIRKRLFSGHARHSIAEDDRPALFAGASGRGELSNDIFTETRAEHSKA